MGMEAFLEEFGYFRGEVWSAMIACLSSRRLDFNIGIQSQAPLRFEYK
jgi:hypothetical protein